MYEKKKGQNTVGHSVNGRRRKDERRASCIARKKEYDKLSVAEKLAKLPPEGAKRQRARLQGLLKKK